MKQTIKKVETAKVSTPKETSTVKTDKAGKVDDLLAAQKTNLFNRFLEANCDCV